MIISRLFWAGEQTQGLLVDRRRQPEGKKGAASVAGSLSPRKEAGCNRRLERMQDQ